MAEYQSTCFHVEKWHPIPGYEGQYAVSSTGRVRNLRSGKDLTPYIGDKAGHLRVSLPSARYYVHVLVAEAFIGPRPEGMEVCHGDNDPANNQVSNLRWDTRSENVMDLRLDKTKCKHGHPWIRENIYTDPNGWQSCRVCRRIARAEYRKKVKING